jgi:hypothetical protein
MISSTIESRIGNQHPRHPARYGILATTLNLTAMAWTLRRAQTAPSTKQHKLTITNNI